MTLRALYDLPAPAKLNLFLHVVGRRADGYHLLQSLMLPIDWCDTLHFERREDGRLARHDLGDPLPADDLCLRAARALQLASGTPLGADISIAKQLPAGAGLGGGSSDAATTLIALNRLWGLDWPRPRLAAIGLRVGADVPFFLGPGPALVEGIGDRLTPVDLPAAPFAVLKPAAGLDTRAVFESPHLVRDSPLLATADILAGFPAGQPAEKLRGAGEVAERDGVVQRILRSTRNDLQAAAESICEEVARAANQLFGIFGHSRMTGSGSSVFAMARGGPGQQGAALAEGLPPGWVGRMCMGLAVHPLAEWLQDPMLRDSREDRDPDGPGRHGRDGAFGTET